MSNKHYVELDPPIGSCVLVMDQQKFMDRAAALFSTFQDSDHTDHESAVHWFEMAGRSSMVFG